MTWLTSPTRFRVYTPIALQRWSLYQARRYAMPFIWLAWLVRGLRLRAGLAKRGRAVTVDDMLGYHPGKPWRCLCRGSGIVASHVKGERGISFCAVMLRAFRARAGFRVVQTRRGPRWLAGYEPERLVGPARKAAR